MRLHGRQQRRSEHPSQHALQPRRPGMVLLRNASWSCNGCTDLAMQILHDDDDDDDGEVYFSGKRSVKRSRCPRSHGWRSRRLKNTASGRQAVRQHHLTQNSDSENVHLTQTQTHSDSCSARPRESHRFARMPFSQACAHAMLAGDSCAV